MNSLYSSIAAAETRGIKLFLLSSARKCESIPFAFLSLYVGNKKLSSGESLVGLDSDYSGVLEGPKGALFVYGLDGFGG